VVCGGWHCAGIGSGFLRPRGTGTTGGRCADDDGEGEARTGVRAAALVVAMCPGARVSKLCAKGREGVDRHSWLLNPSWVEKSPKPRISLPDPPEFRRRIVELVRSGRVFRELAREFECSDQTLRNRVRRADLDEGRREGRQGMGVFGNSGTVDRVGPDSVPGHGATDTQIKERPA